MASFESEVENAVKPGLSQVFPGCAFVAMNKDGVFYEKAFGRQSVDPNSPLAEKPFALDTTMWIASCTKLMTSICIMQCVEKGLLDLDADISTILPEWKEATLLKGFEEGTGKPIIELVKNKITLKHLLTHSSGLGYIKFDPRLQQWAKAVGREPTETSSLHDIAFTPLLFEPGEGWTYGVGIDWAGQMVERVNNNQKLGDYMKEHIWDPLGMKLTTFRIGNREDIRLQRAEPSVRDPATGALIPSPAPVWSEENEDDHGGAGAFSCTEDYCKVLAAIIRNDGTLLKPSSIDTLFTPFLSPASKAALNDLIYVPHPGNENEEVKYALTGGMEQEADPNYALAGYVIEKDAAGRRKKGSMAWGGMPNLYWMLDRESGLALFYATQLFPPGDRQTCELLRKFEDAVYSGQISRGKL